MIAFFFYFSDLACSMLFFFVISASRFSFILVTRFERSSFSLCFWFYSTHISNLCTKMLMVAKRSSIEYVPRYTQSSENPFYIDTLRTSISFRFSSASQYNSIAASNVFRSFSSFSATFYVKSVSIFESGSFLEFYASSLEAATISLPITCTLSLNCNNSQANGTLYKFEHTH